MTTYTPSQIYHIYNRGNNKQTLFFNRANYIFFLNKIRQHIRPHCEILNYCLMPNHFHLLIYADEKTIEPVQSVPPLEVVARVKNTLPIKTKFSEAWRIALSSYTQAINKQEHRTGSLFTQNTKNKQVSDDWMSLDYRHCCFSYIHQNPVMSNLVKNAEDWEFSSYRDYMALRNGTLCNIPLAFELMGFDKIYFDELNSKTWDKKIFDGIF
jgi:putative transposase